MPQWQVFDGSGALLAYFPDCFNCENTRMLQMRDRANMRAGRINFHVNFMCILGHTQKAGMHEFCALYRGHMDFHETRLCVRLFAESTCRYVAHEWYIETHLILKLKLSRFLS